MGTRPVRPLKDRLPLNKKIIASILTSHVTKPNQGSSHEPHVSGMQKTPLRTCFLSKLPWISRITRIGRPSQLRHLPSREVEKWRGKKILTQTAELNSWTSLNHSNMTLRPVPIHLLLSIQDWWAVSTALTILSPTWTDCGRNHCKLHIHSQELSVRVTYSSKVHLLQNLRAFNYVPETSCSSIYKTRQLKAPTTLIVWWRTTPNNHVCFENTNFSLVIYPKKKKINNFWDEL